MQNMLTNLQQIQKVKPEAGQKMGAAQKMDNAQKMSNEKKNEMGK
jgi:hypothetical protein